MFTYLIYNISGDTKVVEALIFYKVPSSYHALGWWVGFISIQKVLLYALIPNFILTSDVNAVTMVLRMVKLHMQYRQK